MTIDSTELGYATGLRRTGARPAKISARMLAVSAGEAMSLTTRAGDEIRCTQGKIWVTFAGDPTDHILTRGESAFAPTRGRAVVQAMTQDGEARIISFSA